MVKQCKVCGAPIVATYKSTNLRYCPAHRPEPPREMRKKLSPEHVARGVPVLYPGCAKWDRYSKIDFDFWLKKREFPDGTEYVLNGEHHTVCNR